MFRPFKWAKWWRIALVGMIAGEFQGASCSGGRRFGESGGPTNPFPSIDPAVIASIITVLVVGGVVLLLVHLYIASVCRFMLFDAITTGRYRLREGWARWHERGVRWFGFNLVFSLIVGLIGLVLLIPFIGTLIAAKRAGIGALLGALAVLVPLFLLLGLFAAVFYVLAKDFAVPVVALENEGVFRAFARVLRLARANVGDFAGYFGIKIALTIAYSIVFSIVAFFVFVIVLVPVVIAVIAAGVSVPHLLENPVMLACVITGFVVGVFVLLFLLACVFSPAIFFFQAYVYTWFAQRYEPLWDLLYPSAPALPTPVTTPEPPPLPAV